MCKILNGRVKDDEAAWFDVVAAVLLKNHVFWGSPTRRSDILEKLNPRYETVQQPCFVLQ
jgi:hypothetical protein